MDRMFSLHFQNHPPFKEEMFIVSNNKLFSYDKGSHTLTETTFHGGAPTTRQMSLPVEYTNVSQMHFDEEGQLLVVKCNEGLVFVTAAEEFKSLGTDDVFHNVYGWDKRGSSIRFGRIYKDPNILGICTFQEGNGVQFYGVKIEDIGIEENPVKFLEMSNTDDILNAESSRVYLARLQANSSESVLVRQESGLYVFELNAELGVDRILSLPQLALTSPDDVLYFPRMVSNPNLVSFNSSGLFLYDSSYHFQLYHPFYSRAHGWTKENHETIRFYDLDREGKEEMMFTGPEGFDIVSLDPSNHLISVYNAGPLGSDYKYIQVFPIGLGQVLVESQGWLRLAHWENETAYVEVEEQKEEPSKNTKFIFPDKFNLAEEEEHTVLLKNQLDHSFLMDSVDVRTGKVKFSLPLVQLSNSMIQLSLSYDGGAVNITKNGLLGKGWNYPLSYIAVDYRDSNFEQDHSYYLSLEGMVFLLEPGESNKFEISDFEDLEIEYFKMDEVWVVKNAKTKVQYKFGGGSTRWDVRWKCWLGQGRANTTERQRVPLEWYLLESQDRYGAKVKYSYDSVQMDGGGQLQYTSELYLTQAQDNNGNKLTLHYDDKLSATTTNEVHRPIFQNRRILKGYTLNTLSYTQNIQFHYVDGLLRSVRQDGESFIEMKYRQDLQMERLELSNSVAVEYKYTMVGTTENIVNTLGHRVYTNRAYRLDYSNVLWITQLTADGQVAVQSMDLEDLEESQQRFPLVGASQAKAFTTALTNTFFAIVLFDSTSATELCLFGRSKGTWHSKQHCYRLTPDTTLRIGNDFIIFKNSSEIIEVLEWKENTEVFVWTTLSEFNNSRKKAVAVYGTRLAVYDNQSVYLCHKLNTWSCFKVKQHEGLIDSFASALQQLNLPTDFINKYVKNLKQSMLQLNANLLSIGSWSATNELFTSHVHLCLLGPGRTCTKDNEKHVTASVKVNKLLEKKVQEFLAALKTHVSQITPTGATLADTAVVFTGSSWDVEKNEEHKVVLDESLQMVMANQNGSIKVVKKNKILLDLGVTDWDKVQVRYPAYIAYPKSDGMIVQQFSVEGDLKDSFSIPFDEKISPWTNTRHLVTEKGSENERYIILRSLAKRLYTPHLVVTQIQTDLGGLKRRIGYEYNKKGQIPSGETIYYNSVLMVPGNDKSTHGYILLDGASNTVYDGEGKIVKKFDQNEAQKKQEEREEDNNNKLYDVTGRFEVAEFSYGYITNEEVSYYGFENYEVNKIGQERKKWKFDTSDVLHSEHSFTGRQVLRLSQNSLPLSGEFILSPLNYYIAASWIKSDRSLHLGAVTTLLKITLVDTEKKEEVVVLGVVKMQRGGWVYVEAIVDVEKVSMLLTNQVIEQGNSNVVAIVRISPVDKETIYIDHARFHPFDSGFKGITYTKTNQVADTLLANGLVRRNHYDEYGRIIATSSELGALEVLKSYTKDNRQKSELEIKPKSGFYEDFDKEAFAARWEITTPAAWEAGPGKLKHVARGSHTLCYRQSLKEYYGIRFRYVLQSSSSGVQLKGMKSSWNLLDKAGEAIVMRDQERVFLWINGHLEKDELLDSSATQLCLQVNGHVLLTGVFLFEFPQLTVTYLNKLEEKTQVLRYESTNSALVKVYLYDDVGRNTIETNWLRIRRTGQEPLLQYAPDIVRNSSPDSARSVWHSSALEGTLMTTDDIMYGYQQTKYANNPLDQVIESGLPGKQFGVGQVFSTKYKYEHKESFLDVMYPTSSNYTHVVEMKPDDVQEITVTNHKDLVVAVFRKSPRLMPLLTTHEYDDAGKCIKTLPPLFHEKANTFVRHKNTDKKLEVAYGTFTEYDMKGNMLTRVTPETGKTEHFYKDDLLSYVVYSDHNGQAKQVLALQYDASRRLVSTGTLQGHFTKETLQQLDVRGQVNIAQVISYNDLEAEPTLRGRVQRYITVNDAESVAEEQLMDGDGNVLRKSLVFFLPEDEAVQVVLASQYRQGQLTQMEYPSQVRGKPLLLRLEHDRLGRLVEVGLKGSKENLVEFSYTSQGFIAVEKHLSTSKHGFTRRFEYNYPGFLARIQDRYLTQELLYDELSYGGQGYGDGTVTMSKFSAHWHNLTTGLRPDSFVSNTFSAQRSQLCFQSLNTHGYINLNGKQKTVFYPETDINLPLECSLGSSGRYVQQVLGSKGYPETYGHVYEYGNQQELTKAKYFVGETSPEPLQPDTFHKRIRGLDRSTSARIWNELKQMKYITVDSSKTTREVHGKKFRSIVRSSLHQDLKAASSSFVKYEEPIRKLLTHATAHGVTLDFERLKEAMLRWQPGVAESQIRGIWEVLQKNDYTIRPFTSDFQQLLDRYHPYKSKLVKTLLYHWGSELGEAEFDVESYEIDSNGNHRKFYSGPVRFEFTYLKNSNQIDKVYIMTMKSNREYELKHDYRGNVVRAMHKDIHRIEYNYVLNRPAQVHLTDGRSLHFLYDYRGERVLKRMINTSGKTEYEVHYFRDARGRSLAERKVSYLAQYQAPDIEITSYIYGPRGLVGFLRQEQYYSVLLDHEGSVRLVLHDGEVVAAYDYMPYGGLMREWMRYPSADLRYRYTGQEWDEELGIYNYHARWYDPDLGRFYQVDPKEQHPSPYMYAGNSPVSYVDPDGQIAIIIPIAAAIVGAYLGGAAANNKWLPWKWDYKKGSTWAGLVLGGIGGAVAPYGVAASFGALTTVMSTGMAVTTLGGIGLGTGYLSMAAVNDDWNPAKWDYTSPTTWNAAFVGVTTGTSMIGGVGVTKTWVAGLSSKGKVLFGVGAATSGGTLFVLGGVSNNWDLSKPGMWNSILQSMIVATDAPYALASGFKIMHKNGRLALSSFNELVPKIFRQNALGRYRGGAHIALRISDIAKMHEFKSMIKAIGVMTLTPVSVGAGAYLIGSASTESWKWDMKDSTTYTDLINNLLTALDFTKAMGKGSAAMYKKREAARLQRKSDAVQLEARTVAERSVEIYYQRLKDGHFDNHLSARGKEYINEGTLPNRSVSVSILKKHIVVTYSTNTEPGMIFMYERKGLGSPLVRVDLPSNKNVGGPIILHFSLEESNQIRQSIQDAQLEIRKNVANEFREETNNMLRRLEDIDVPHNIKENLLSRVADYVGMYGVDASKLRDFVNSYFNSHTQDIITFLEQDPNKFKTRRAELKQLERMKLQYAKEKTKKLMPVVMEALETPKKQLTVWCPTNCAEAHAVTALARWNEVIGEPLAPHRYFTQDIRYLATYMISAPGPSTHTITPNPVLTPFPRCDHCVRTTADVHNVITDTSWVTKLADQDNQYNNAVEKLKQHAKRFYTFPSRLLNAWNNTDSKEREKRQTSQLWLPHIERHVNMKQLNSSSQPPAPGLQAQSTDLNSTLLLMDVLTRKFTGRSYVRGPGEVSDMAASTRALRITERFRRSLRAQLGDEVDASIDLFQLQTNIYKLIKSDRKSQILDLLVAHARELNQTYNLDFNKLAEKLPKARPI